MGIDSGHWYTVEGAPFYTTRSRNGEERGVTLRDARKINAVPSVTTVLQVVAKPQLEAWKVRQGILAALTLPRAEGEDDDAYLARVLADSRQQAKLAAEEGTRIHDAIEQSFKGGRVPDAYLPHVDATRRKIAELFPGVTDWIAETSFAHPSGYGGKVDLHSPSTGIVIDYKGKDGELWNDAKHAYSRVTEDGEAKDKKCDYDQNYQLGAYQRGLRFPTTICANLFVSRTHPGSVCARVWTCEEIADAIDIFMDALSLWKKIKRYESGFTKAQAA